MGFEKDEVQTRTKGLSSTMAIRKYRKRSMVSAVLLCGSALAAPYVPHTEYFTINKPYSGAVGQQQQNSGYVNTDPGTLAYAALPTCVGAWQDGCSQTSDIGKMLFSNFWQQTYTLNKISSVRWFYLDGSDINLNATGGGGDCPYSPTCSPIVLDLDRDGIDLGAAGVGVHFDMDADGATEYTQWVRPGGDESFLARDLNDNGVVDNGSELFGGATLMELEGNRHGARRLASNGFQALAQYDRVVLGGNRDGLITTSDAVWDQLLLWRDGNADGVSTSDEIVPLGDAVQTLGISPFKSKELDKAGNWLALWDWAVGLGGDKLPMVDVFFASP